MPFEYAVLRELLYICTEYTFVYNHAVMHTIDGQFV